MILLKTCLCCLNIIELSEEDEKKEEEILIEDDLSLEPAGYICNECAEINENNK